jgi:hypothetical protein
VEVDHVDGKSDEEKQEEEEHVGCWAQHLANRTSKDLGFGVWGLGQKAAALERVSELNPKPQPSTLNPQ